MRKYYLTFIAWFIAFSISNAQDSTISVQLPVTSLSQGTTNISSITVVSKLADSAFIGVLPSASPNVRTNVVISQGVSSWLQNYVQQVFAGNFQAGGNSLTWAISELRIGKDSSSTGATSFTKLTADVFDSVGGNAQLLTSFDTILVSTNLTTDFGQSLVIAINALYNYSVSTSLIQGKQSLQNNRIFKKSFMLTNSAKSTDTTNANAKIILDSVYQTGIFATYQEFLNDSPSITNFYTAVDSATKAVTLFSIQQDSSAQPVSTAWGICIYNELYRYQNGQLYAIEKDGTGFTLSKYIDFHVRKNRAIFWRRYIGNVQGDNNPFNDAHISFFAMSLSQRYARKQGHCAIEAQKPVQFLAY